MRNKFTFWLDDSKQAENLLIGQVDSLKDNRLFSKTIRDGIRLIVDLRKGSLEVLFELFPFVRAEFMEYVKDTLPDNRNDNSDIKREIARLESLIIQQGKSNTNIMKPLSGGLQPIGGLKPLAPPAYDEDDFQLEVTKAGDSGINAAQNFLASMQALQA